MHEKKQETNRVELLYFPDCPNVSLLRERLRSAFETLGLNPDWSEVDISSDAAPAHTRGYASPSILINGKDLMGATPVKGYACRIYLDNQESGLPSVETIINGLLQSSPKVSG